MRETANLKLTQFDGSDVPNWLDQYNSDNLKIDTAIGEQAVKNTEFSNTNENLQTQITNNRNQINENTQDIANIKDDIKNIKGGSDVNLNTLQGEITTLEQTVTNLKGGSTRTIAELENDLNTDQQNISKLGVRVGTLESDSTTKEEKITKLENIIGTESIANVAENITTAIGNESLNTTEKTLSGAINELHNANTIVFKVVNSANIIRRNEHELIIRVSLGKPLKDFGIKNGTTLGGTAVALRDNDTGDNLYCFSAYNAPITDDTTTSFDLNYETENSFSTTNTFIIKGSFLVYKF